MSGPSSSQSDSSAQRSLIPPATAAQMEMICTIIEEPTEVNGEMFFPIDRSGADDVYNRFILEKLQNNPQPLNLGSYTFSLQYKRGDSSTTVYQSSRELQIVPCSQRSIPPSNHMQPLMDAPPVEDPNQSQPHEIQASVPGHSGMMQNVGPRQNGFQNQFLHHPAQSQPHGMQPLIPGYPVTMNNVGQSRNDFHNQFAQNETQPLDPSNSACVNNVDPPHNGFHNQFEDDPNQSQPQRTQLMAPSHPAMMNNFGPSLNGFHEQSQPHHTQEPALGQPAMMNNFGPPQNGFHAQPQPQQMQVPVSGHRAMMNNVGPSLNGAHSQPQHMQVPVPGHPAMMNNVGPPQNGFHEQSQPQHMQVPVSGHKAMMNNVGPLQIDFHEQSPPYHTQEPALGHPAMMNNVGPLQIDFHEQSPPYHTQEPALGQPAMMNNVGPPLNGAHSQPQHMQVPVPGHPEMMNNFGPPQNGFHAQSQPHHTQEPALGQPAMMNNFGPPQIGFYAQSQPQHMQVPVSGHQAMMNHVGPPQNGFHEQSQPQHMQVPVSGHKAMMNNVGPLQIDFHEQSPPYHTQEPALGQPAMMNNVGPPLNGAHSQPRHMQVPVSGHQVMMNNVGPPLNGVHEQSQPHPNQFQPYGTQLMVPSHQVMMNRFGPPLNGFHAQPQPHHTQESTLGQPAMMNNVGPPQNGIHEQSQPQHMQVPVSGHQAVMNNVDPPLNGVHEQSQPHLNQSQSYGAQFMVPSHQAMMNRFGPPLNGFHAQPAPHHTHVSALVHQAMMNNVGPPLNGFANQLVQNEMQSLAPGHPAIMNNVGAPQSDFLNQFERNEIHSAMMDNSGPQLNSSHNQFGPTTSSTPGGQFAFVSQFTKMRYIGVGENPNHKQPQKSSANMYHPWNGRGSRGRNNKSQKTDRRRRESSVQFLTPPSSTRPQSVDEYTFGYVNQTPPAQANEFIPNVALVNGNAGQGTYENASEPINTLAAPPMDAGVAGRTSDAQDGDQHTPSGSSANVDGDNSVRVEAPANLPAGQSPPNTKDNLGEENTGKKENIKNDEVKIPANPYVNRGPQSHRKSNNKSEDGTNGTTGKESKDISANKKNTDKSNQKSKNNNEGKTGKNVNKRNGPKTYVIWQPPSFVKDTREANEPSDVPATKPIDADERGRASDGQDGRGDQHTPAGSSESGINGKSDEVEITDPTARNAAKEADATISKKETSSTESVQSPLNSEDKSEGGSRGTTEEEENLKNSVKTEVPALPIVDGEPQTPLESEDKSKESTSGTTGKESKDISANKKNTEKSNQKSKNNNEGKTGKNVNKRNGPKTYVIWQPPSFVKDTRKANEPSDVPATKPMDADEGGRASNGQDGRGDQHTPAGSSESGVDGKSDEVEITDPTARNAAKEADATISKKETSSTESVQSPLNSEDKSEGGSSGTTEEEENLKNSVKTEVPALPIVDGESQTPLKSKDKSKESTSGTTGKGKNGSSGNKKKSGKKNQKKSKKHHKGKKGNNVNKSNDPKNARSADTSNQSDPEGPSSPAANSGESNNESNFGNPSSSAVPVNPAISGDASTESEKSSSAVKKGTLAQVSNDSLPKVPVVIGDQNGLAEDLREQMEDEVPEDPFSNAPNNHHQKENNAPVNAQKSKKNKKKKKKKNEEEDVAPLQLQDPSDSETLNTSPLQNSLFPQQHGKVGDQPEEKSDLSIRACQQHQKIELECQNWMERYTNNVTSSTSEIESMYSRYDAMRQSTIEQRNRIDEEQNAADAQRLAEEKAQKYTVDDYFLNTPRDSESKHAFENLVSDERKAEALCVWMGGLAEANVNRLVDNYYIHTASNYPRSVASMRKHSGNTSQEGVELSEFTDWLSQKGTAINMICQRLRIIPEHEKLHQFYRRVLNNFNPNSAPFLSKIGSFENYENDEERLFEAFES